MKVTGITGAGANIRRLPGDAPRRSSHNSHAGMAPRAYISTTIGEGSRVLQPLHHIDLVEFVPKVRDLHVQAHGVSGWVVLLTMAFDHVYLNYTSDSAGCAPDWPPIVCAAGGFLAPGFFSGGVFLRNSPASFEVTHWAKELAKKRVALGTAVTCTLERVFPAISPEGLAASLHAAGVACGQVRGALLEPESQLLLPG